MSLVEHIDYYSDITDFPVHKHAACEMIYIKNGTIEMTCNETAVTAQSGEIVFVPSSLLHKTKVKSTVYERELIFFNPFAFSGKFVSTIFSSVIMGLNVKNILKAKDDFECKTLCDKMYTALHSPDFVSEEILCTSLSEILLNIIKQNQEQCTQHIITNPIVEDAMRFISENCCEKLRISDLCEKYHLSKFYFTHLFKEQTGLSPREFLTFSRISAAHQMLYDKSLSISEISEKCGFTSPSDMTRKFREEYSITPKQYRARL